MSAWGWVLIVATSLVFVLLVACAVYDIASDLLHERRRTK